MLILNMGIIILSVGIFIRSHFGSSLIPCPRNGLDCKPRMACRSGPTMSSVRTRYGGTWQAFVDLLEPFVVTKNFIAYDDCYEDARVQPELILKNIPMWEACHQQQANLSFGKCVTTDAFKDILKKKSNFGLPADDVKDWSATISARFRAQGRHIHQAELKSKSTKWLSNFSWISAATTTSSATRKSCPRPQLRPQVWPLGGSVGTTTTAATTGLATWWFGWDSEHQAAFRSLPDGSQHEFAKEIIADDAAAPTDPVEAKWEDGVRHFIADVTVKEWQDLQQAAKDGAKKVAQVHWSGTHVTTGKPLYIKDRQDRHPLLSLYEESH
jgi:hypothetical protein